MKIKQFNMIVGKNGKAGVYAGGETPEGVHYDFARPLRSTDVVDGVRVSDYEEGSYTVFDIPDPPDIRIPAQTRTITSNRRQR